MLGIILSTTIETFGDFLNKVLENPDFLWQLIGGGTLGLAGALGLLKAVVVIIRKASKTDEKMQAMVQKNIEPIIGDLIVVKSLTSKIDQSNEEIKNFVKTEFKTQEQLTKELEISQLAFVETVLEEEMDLLQYQNRKNELRIEYENSLNTTIEEEVVSEDKVEIDKEEEIVDEEPVIEEEVEEEKNKENYEDISYA